MSPPKLDPNVASLTEQLGRLSTERKDDFVLADTGKAGKTIAVEANMYQVRQTTGLITYDGEADCSHYDVDIKRVVKTASDKMPKELARKIWNQTVREYGKGDLKAALDSSAFDGMKNAYMAIKLPLEANGKKEFVVALPEPGRELDDRSRFKVILQVANEIDPQTVVRFCRGERQSTQELELVLTAIQAMNVLFREDPTSRFTPKGARGRFFGLDGQVPISQGGVVGKGFIQSFRPTASGLPAIQLDTAYTAFFKAGPAIDVMGEVLGIGAGGPGGRGGRGGGRGGPRGGGRGGPPAPGGGQTGMNDLNPNQIRQLSKLFWGAKFTLPYKKIDRTFTIKKLTLQPASDIKFRLNGKYGAPDRDIGLVQYFKEQYNITITKPRLPCVMYGKNFMVPLELVVMANFNSIPFASLTSDQAADMIRVAAQRPPERCATIKQWRKTLNYDALPKLKAWGVQVHPNMIGVQARVLPTPRVTYAKGKQLNVSNGGWNLKGVSFTQPGAPLKSWTVISFDQRSNSRALEPFIRMLIPTLGQYGVRVENQKPNVLQFQPGFGGFPGVTAGLTEAAKQAYMQSKAAPQLILVVMPRKDTALYAAIKRVAAYGLKAPVVTQCVQAMKVAGQRGPDPMYCGNLAMKIHSKLGGVTHEVAPPAGTLDKTTMLVGADVTHPPASRGLIQPSIAVSVAGTNGDNVRFETSIREQEGRQEIIGDLQRMMKTHIANWEKRTKSKPAKIIFYRDGVSEGQYLQVCNAEVAAIKNAAKEFGAGYDPKVTFIICAKRHNMRFFAKSEQDTDRTGNLPPGLVVDTTVTNPFAFDFYLQAHSGLQGTARPTHYVVLKDENRFTADKMQAMTNALCSTFARATRSVSLVPVAYYADIIATQARAWVYTDDESTETATSVSSGPQQTKQFDAMSIARRLEGTDFHKVAWFM